MVSLPATTKRNMRIASTAPNLGSVAMVLFGLAPYNIPFSIIGIMLMVLSFAVPTTSSLMITSGRFKGKMLMQSYDVHDIEDEVFNKPIEQVIADINSSTRIDSTSQGSWLATSTIERLELELDPMCPCSISHFGKHRTSKHEEYLKADIERLSREAKALQEKIERQHDDYGDACKYCGSYSHTAGSCWDDAAIMKYASKKSRSNDEYYYDARGMKRYI